VGPDGLFPEFIDAKFGNCHTALLTRFDEEGLGEIRTFSSYSLPQFSSEFLLCGILLEIVDVDVAVELPMSFVSCRLQCVEKEESYKAPRIPASRGSVKRS
jgi:hypothetical protein